MWETLRTMFVELPVPEDRTQVETECPTLAMLRAELTQLLHMFFDTGELDARGRDRLREGGAALRPLLDFPNPHVARYYGAFRTVVLTAYMRTAAGFPRRTP
jgi:hypothetical protein